MIDKTEGPSAALLFSLFRVIYTPFYENKTNKRKGDIHMKKFIKQITKWFNAAYSDLTEDDLAFMEMCKLS